MFAPLAAVFGLFAVAGGAVDEIGDARGLLEDGLEGEFVLVEGDPGVGAAGAHKDAIGVSGYLIDGGFAGVDDIEGDRVGGKQEGKAAEDAGIGHGGVVAIDDVEHEGADGGVVDAAFGEAAELFVLVVGEADVLFDGVFKDDEIAVGEDEVGVLAVVEDLVPEGVDGGGRAKCELGAAAEGVVLEEQGGGGEEEEGGEGSEVGDVVTAVGEGWRGEYSGDGLAGMEEEGVGAFGEIGDEGFVAAFLVEVLLEFFTELGGLDADEGVLAGVVVFGAAEDTDADVVFAEVGVAVGEGVVADEEEEFAEAVGFLESRAGGDAGEEFAARVGSRLGGGGLGGSRLRSGRRDHDQRKRGDEASIS